MTGRRPGAGPRAQRHAGNCPLTVDTLDAPHHRNAHGKHPDRIPIDTDVVSEQPLNNRWGTTPSPGLTCGQHLRAACRRPAVGPGQLRHRVGAHIIVYSQLRVARCADDVADAVAGSARDVVTASMITAVIAVGIKNLRAGGIDGSSPTAARRR